MKTAKLPRKEREKLRHREEILQVALSLFSGKGFHNVSMHEIAEKSDFAVGTLYNFFDSKKALFEGLINSFGERIVGEFTEVLDGPGNEAERLVAFVRSQPQLQEKYSEFIKLYASVFGTKGVAISKIRDESKIKETLHLKITQLVEQGIHNGLFRHVDPAITAKAIAATIESLTFEIAGCFDRAKVTEMFKKVEQLFIGGLLVPESTQNE